MQTTTTIPLLGTTHHRVTVDLELARLASGNGALRGLARRRIVHALGTLGLRTFGARVDDAITAAAATLSGDLAALAEAHARHDRAHAAIRSFCPKRNGRHLDLSRPRGWEMDIPGRLWRLYHVADPIVVAAALVEWVAACDALGLDSTRPPWGIEETRAIRLDD